MGTTKQPENDEQMAFISLPIIIALNVSGLNSPIKKHHVAEWIKTQNPTICWLQDSLQLQRHIQDGKDNSSKRKPKESS